MIIATTINEMTAMTTQQTSTHRLCCLARMLVDLDQLCILMLIHHTDVITDILMSWLGPKSVLHLYQYQTYPAIGSSKSLVPMALWDGGYHHGGHA